jgi:membrane protease subunit HflC
MKKNTMLIIGLIIFVLLLLKLSVFQVSANETAITTLFGKVQYEVNGHSENSVVPQEKSGVFFKVPFFQLVKKYDMRVHIKEVIKKDRLTADEKNINISLAIGWKIISPKKFYETSDNLFDIENKIEQIIDGSLGQIVGRLKLDNFFGTNESNGMKDVEAYFSDKNSVVLKEASRYGLEIVFAKVTHVGFPPAVLPTILERMKAERSKESAVYIAEGTKEAKIILDQAESEKEKKLAEARSAAKVARSDAQKNLSEYYKVLSDSPELSSYLRKLDSFKKTFDGKGQKRFILDPENFLKEFEKNMEATR